MIKFFYFYFLICIQLKKIFLIPKLIWISINGISPKYINNNTMPFIHNMKKYGAFCNNLENNFYANDYPTSYSMSTGFYPKHHGILSDEMMKNNQTKIFSKTKYLKEWWTNNNFTIFPIWLSEYLYHYKSSTFCIDWPGCNVNYAVESPIYIPGDSTLNSKSRINIALNYAKFSSKTSLILIHLSEIMDLFIKNQNETFILEKLKIQDNLFENMFNDLSKYNILKETNILITSAFSGSIINENNIITISKYTKIKDYIVIYEGKILALYFLNQSKIQHFINNLKILTSKNIIKIFKQNEINKNYLYKLDDRLPHLFIIASPGYCLRMKSDSNACFIYKNGRNKDDIHEKGFLYVTGPNINKNINLGTLNVVDVYPLLCALLDINPCNKNNGTIAKVATALSMHHPIFSDVPGVKSIITCVIIIALILTIISFGYLYTSNLYEKQTINSKTELYLKSAYSYERMNLLD